MQFLIKAGRGKTSTGWIEISAADEDHAWSLAAGMFADMPEGTEIVVMGA